MKSELNFTPGPLLAKTDSPQDLRQLSHEQLPQICDELRRYIIDIVSINPGHLGASLGAVELAVAIHYVFNTPTDKLIWDVGHQAYAHKILTGRRDEFHKNRKYKGISGFPKMSESEYDAFGVGHSSTSISAALGMAMAAKLQGLDNQQHIAVIGDGSMTAGMAFEALNHAGTSKANILVILNDNGIAIDANVGALREYLAEVTASQLYNRIRDRIWHLLGGGSKYGRNTRAVVRQLGNAVKSTFTGRSNIFESYRFRYFGPVDGNDIEKLTRLLTDLKKIQGPKLLHVITKKGKGMEMAEKDPTTYHAPGLFNKDTGVIHKDDCPTHFPPKYQNVFGKTIIELARQNPKIVGITPAMPSGCSLNMMMAVMPERAFDVGIAEQHAVTYSAGLAAQGMLPFCNIYSSFMQRAFDQVIHDVALQKLSVVFCLDRGGLVGEDGATHHGVFDLAYFRSIPNMVVAAPMDEIELRNMMYSAQLPDRGPYSIRYPRGRGMHDNWKLDFIEIITGEGRVIKEDGNILILSIGHPGNFVTEAINKLSAKGVLVAHYDMRFVKPLDEKLLHKAFQNFEKIITVEDGSLQGGFGSAVLEFMSDHGYSSKVKRLGVPDHFIEQGSPEELYHECGFDADGIIKSVEDFLR
ncbi:MAG: 1-deoxy-D-xylulose-5-phosphate synthase [Bacteroidales bacterium]|nr:1-deoxy-D-xylulose-5-phosphate synthase [Bacteroidales bacterium]